MPIRTEILDLLPRIFVVVALIQKDLTLYSRRTAADMETDNPKAVTLSEYSQLSSSFSSCDDGALLLAQFSGSYKIGSLGNGDGMFMFSMLAAHYLLFESICIVLDLRKLEYSWGNTISKSINFFSEIGRDAEEREKRVIILATGETLKSLLTLDERFDSGNRS